MVSEDGLSHVLHDQTSASPTGTRMETMPPTTAPSANGVSTDAAAKTVSTVRRSPGGPGADVQRVGRSAGEDTEQGEEQRHRQRRADSTDRHRVRRPGHGEHEDQPDVVGLPDRGQSVVRMVAQPLGRRSAAGRHLPHPGAEVGATERSCRPRRRSG